MPATPAAAAPDPYAELSIPPSASAEQIRRAYKAACLCWHPDKHPSGVARSHAEARFKAIVRAYTLLSDPSSRAAHDASRPTDDPFADAAYRSRFAEGFARQFAREGHAVDADKLFESLFGQEERQKFDERARNWQTMEKSEDREIDLPLSLEDLYAGCIKKRRLRNTDPQTAVVLSIVVRPGYRPGDRVRFKDAAVEDGRRPGDVVFVLTQKPHDRFAVDGDHLRITMQVRLVDALAGAVVIVKGLDGKDVKVRVDDVIHPGYVHVVTGRGMPRRSSPDQCGDLHIAFDITFPGRVEADDRAAVRDLFARLDAHANCRMAIRRSSSLFMSKGGAASILSPRRNSTGTPAGRPPIFPENRESSDEAEGIESVEEEKAESVEEEKAENDTVQTQTTSGIPTTKSRIHRSRLRFPSIFR